MDWNPEPGETLLFRGAVSFATGYAFKVAGMHWFRDDQGNDIGAEIPGWPPAPVYVKRGDKSVKAGKALFGVAKVATVAVAATIEALNLGSSNIKFGGKPQDPAMEVEDFPVMVAPFGTVARTMPWQLDSDRRPEDYYSDLFITDQRLVVQGPIGVDQPTEVLWQLPLDQVAGARQHAYATSDGDVTISFVDGSWVRLNFEGPGRAAKVVWVLSGNTEPLELNEVQRQRMEHLMRDSEGVLEIEAIPVPDAPPGTVSFELVTREANGRRFQHGAGILTPEGKAISRR